LQSAQKHQGAFFCFVHVLQLKTRSPHVVRYVGAQLHPEKIASILSPNVGQTTKHAIFPEARKLVRRKLTTVIQVIFSGNEKV